MTLLAFALQAASPAAAARADEPAVGAPTARAAASARETRLIVPVRLGQAALGDVPVRLTAGGGALAEATALSIAFRDVLRPETLTAIAALADADGFIPIEATAPLGLSLTLDMRALSLRATIVGDATQARTLALNSGSRLTGLPPAPVSGVASGILNTTYREADDEFEYRALLSGALRTGPVVLDAVGRYEALPRGSALLRERVALVYDRPNQFFRVEAGDLIPIARGFQSPGRLGGVSIVRSRNVLRPGVRAASNLPGAFVLEQEADVDIIINGSTVRRARLAPGRYDLSDFPLAAGNNQIEVLVRDDAGQERRFTFDRFFDALELDPGDSEFAVYVGAAETPSSRDLSYDSSLIRASGFYRRNFDGRYTLGAYADVVDGAALVGAEAAFNLANGGRLLVDVAGFQGDDAAAGALRLDYDVFGPFDYDRPDTLVFTLEHRGDGFRSNPLLALSESLPYEISGRYTRRLAENWSTSFSLAQTSGPDDNASTSAGFDLDYENEEIRIGFSLRYSDDLEEETAALLRISRPLGRRMEARVSHETSANRTVAAFSRRSIDARGSWSLDAEAGTQNGETEGALLSTYEGGRFVAGVSALQQNTGLTGESAATATVRLGSAVGFAGTRFGWGRPADGSFAIVRRVGSAEEVQVRVDPFEDRERAAIGGLGPLLYPLRGAAYSVQTVRVAIDALPAGQDPGPSSFAVEPAFRSGVALAAGALPSATVVAVLVDQAGAPVTLRAVRVQDADDPDRPIPEAFTNSRGLIVLNQLEVGGTYVLSVPSLPGVSARVTLGADQIGIVRLPDLELRP